MKSGEERFFVLCKRLLLVNGLVIFSYFWLLGKGIMIFPFLYSFFVVINRRITFKFYYKKWRIVGLLANSFHSRRYR